jgi:hypothetical protein
LASATSPTKLGKPAPASGPKSIFDLRTSIVLIVVLASLPFFFAPFPPSTDLAQHLAQIRMARDVLSGNSPELFIAWLAPNNLIYALLGFLWFLMPAVLAARAGLWFIVTAWALATLALAVKRQRSLVPALVAGMLAFQAGVYWGFINFLIGWPVFVAWIHLTDQPVDRSGVWRRIALRALVALLLYEAHVLWFLMGGIWLLGFGLLRRWPVRAFAHCLAALVPGLLLGGLWYPTMMVSRSLFRTRAFWITTPWQRLYPPRLCETLMGGQAGAWPAITGGALIAWIAAVLITRRSDLRRGCDRTLLLTAGLFGAIAILAPDQYMNSIMFAQRWAPCAVALLLVGLPEPRFPLYSEVVGLVIGAASITTSLAWRTFTNVEMDGLQAALDASPVNAHVLELDAVRQSEVVGGQPFMQMMAYFQAEKGGAINFSFAEHGSCLVGYRQPRNLTWTPTLEWHPERVQREDFQQFDVVLVNGTPEVHQRFERTAPVTPKTASARWRLYAVQKSGR